MKKRFWKWSASSALIAALLLAGPVPAPHVGAPFAVFTQVASAEDAPAVPKLDVQSESALLMDAATGQILWAKDEHAKRYPASVTKIMTMLLAYEAVAKGEKQLTDIVPISKSAYGVEGSSVWLDPKEKWTLQDMIEFIAIPSANDACVAVAEFVGGSEEGFVARMNAKAKELGMKDTHFTDSNGLHQPEHYTSANDIAIMARELINKYPHVLETTKIKSKMIREGKFKLENTNHVLGNFAGMDGLKTGFTDEAGYCLTGTAVRDGFRLISVQLKAPNDLARVNDTKKILDFGYANFKREAVVKKGEAAAELAPVEDGVETEIEAVAEQYLNVAVPKNGGALEKKAVFTAVTAPVAKDQVVGQLQVVQNGTVISSVNLLAKQDVEEASWMRLAFRGIGDFFSGIFSGIGNFFSDLF